MAVTIWGYAPLKDFTHLEADLVRRAMAHYQFPRPVKMREGSVTRYVWDKNLVSEWMRQNHMLYFVRNARLRALPEPVSDIERYFPAAKT